jgi:hypothetical protein
VQFLSCSRSVAPYDGQGHEASIFWTLLGIAKAIDGVRDGFTAVLTSVKIYILFLWNKQVWA